MSFWTDITFREPLRQNRWYLSFSNGEPLKNIPFTPNSLNGQTYALKTCTKPSLSIELMEATKYNTFKYFPRTYKWKPITVTMVSGLGNNNTTPAAMALYEMIFGISRTIKGEYKFFPKYGGGNLKQTFDEELGKITEQEENNANPTTANPEQRNAWLAQKKELTPNITLEKIYKSMPSMNIFQVNPEGKIIENWTLSVPMITDINWGQLSYENDGFVDIEFKIQYWYAELNTYFQYDSNFDKSSEEKARRDKEEAEKAAKEKEQADKLRKEGIIDKVQDALSALKQVQKPIAQQQAEAKAQSKTAATDIKNQVFGDNLLGQSAKPLAQQQAEAKKAEAAQQEKIREQATEIVKQSGVKQAVNNLQTENEFQKRFNPDSPFKDQQQSTQEQTSAQPRRESTPQQQSNIEPQQPRRGTTTQSYSNMSDADRALADRLEREGTPSRPTQQSNTQTQPSQESDRQLRLTQQQAQDQYNEARRLQEEQYNRARQLGGAGTIAGRQARETARGAKSQADTLQDLYGVK